MLLRDRVEFLESEFTVGKLALVLGSIDDMAFADAFRVAFGDQFDESIL